MLGIDENRDPDNAPTARRATVEGYFLSLDRHPVALKENWFCEFIANALRAIDDCYTADCTPRRKDVHLLESQAHLDESKYLLLETEQKK